MGCLFTCFKKHTNKIEIINSSITDNSKSIEHKYDTYEENFCIICTTRKTINKDQKCNYCIKQRERINKFQL